jgi:hypothetical protein
MDQVAIEITDDAMADLRALRSKPLQRVALEWISRPRRNPKLGALLEWRWGQGLRDCRKIYFDEGDTPLELNPVARRRSEEDGARYRIVYRLLPSGAHPETARAFAAGPKYGPEGGVYAEAAKRYRLMSEGESPRVDGDAGAEPAHACAVRPSAAGTGCAEPLEGGVIRRVVVDEYSSEEASRTSGLLLEVELRLWPKESTVNKAKVRPCRPRPPT